MGIKELKQEEEARIRALEAPLYDFARLFYAGLVDYFNDNDEVADSVEKLRDPDTLVDILKSSPITERRELRRNLSKMGIKWGRINDGDKVVEEEFAIDESYHVLDGLVSKAYGFSPSAVAQVRLTKPIFYREDDGEFTHIDLSETALTKLPPRFFENPTKFIERCKNIDRDGSSRDYDIEDIFGMPYDFTKIKSYKNLVFKRVELNKVNHAEEELQEAERIRGLLSGFDDKRVQVQEFLGTVWHQGNIYLVSRKICGRNENDLISEWHFTTDFSRSEAVHVCNSLKDYLSGRHYDVASRNLIVGLRRGTEYHDEKNLVGVTVIDFETKPYD